MSSEQGFWQTLPGIITAIAGCISAIAGLIIALNQAGVFKDHDEPAGATPSASSASTMSAPPVAPPASAPGTGTPHIGKLEGQALLDELSHANVHYSVSDKQMREWLAADDRSFLRIAQATTRLLEGRRIRGDAPDLDVIKYHYLEMTGANGDSTLPADARIDDETLRQAIIAAFNDKNGAHAKRFDAITDPR